MRVSGVQGFSSYRALMDYLGAHVGVREARLVKAEGDTVLSEEVLANFAAGASAETAPAAAPATEAASVITKENYGEPLTFPRFLFARGKNEAENLDY